MVAGVKPLKWTAENVDFLRENHQSMTVSELSRALGCTVPAVRAQLRKYGWQAMTYNFKWTREHVDFLLSQQGLMSHAEIAKVIGCSKSQVDTKVRRLKFTNPSSEVKPKPKSNSGWLSQEIKVLREVVPVDGVGLAAYRLKRDVSDVVAKVAELGISQPESFQERADSLISLTFCEDDDVVRVIALTLGWKVLDVRKRVRVLNRELGRSYREWSEAEDDVLRQHYKSRSVSSIAGELGRSYDSVHHRAGVLGLTDSSRSGRFSRDSRVWSEADDSVIRASLVSAGVFAVAQELDRSVPAVRQRAEVLGLPVSLRSAERPWFAGELAFVRESVGELGLRGVSSAVGRTMVEVCRVLFSAEPEVAEPVEPSVRVVDVPVWDSRSVGLLSRYGASQGAQWVASQVGVSVAEVTEQAKALGVPVSV